ncbi:hypothetical protein EDD18DRAFT_1113696 [Armillaria luteobubalina]|uniref:Uncharacterized protein n=1 Tax=Armillaria luteobubalina TaxID=153913 RepID=A0AA39UI70_9AGAR|nr:hypothetical protein EDD18DRAFT_1113696 [Armillaria luteobubalina]
MGHQRDKYLMLHDSGPHVTIQGALYPSIFPYQKLCRDDIQLSNEQVKSFILVLTLVNSVYLADVLCIGNCSEMTYQCLSTEVFKPVTCKWISEICSKTKGFPEVEHSGQQ